MADWPPLFVEIREGDVVAWVNDSDETYLLEIPGAEMSVQLELGERYAAAFNRAGSYSYRCGIHPPMRGSVDVGGRSPCRYPTGGGVEGVDVSSAGRLPGRTTRTQTAPTLP